MEIGFLVHIYVYIYIYFADVFVCVCVYALYIYKCIFIMFKTPWTSYQHTFPLPFLLFSNSLLFNFPLPMRSCCICVACALLCVFVYVCAILCSEYVLLLFLCSCAICNHCAVRCTRLRLIDDLGVKVKCV